MPDFFDRKAGNKQAWRHRPSQRLLFSALVFLIVLVLVVSFTLASLDNYRRHVKIAEQELLAKAQLVATAHEQWILETRSLMATMAVGVARLEDIPGDCSGLLHRYVSVLNGLDTVLLLNRQGNLLCATRRINKPMNFADRLYFQRALNEKSFSVGRFIIGRVSGERVLPMAFPILDRQGRVKMVLVAGRTLEWIRGVMARQSLSADIAITVVDGEGTVLAHGAGVNYKVEQLYPIAEVREAIKRWREGVMLSRTPEGEEAIVAYTRLGPEKSDVFVIASQSSEHNLEPTLSIIRSNLLQFILTMVIVIGALWVGLGHWVLAPLQRLADTMGLIRAGKSGVRVEDMGPSREFVAIGENFNDMLYTLEATSEKLRRLADNDSLLGIPNRRLLDERLHSEWRRLSRSEEPLSLLMIDVDLFKNYNDYYGHQAGDECLKSVSAVLRSALNRPADMVGRYGGEEFVAVLPETDSEGAVSIACHIQQLMAERGIPHAASSVADYVTLSIGVATMTPAPEQHVDALLESADKALYEAKAGGRNRVESS